MWEDHGLVFTTATGKMLDQHNIRREFRRVTEAAGLGSEWVPSELRHTFVSIMSENGVPVEEIAPGSPGMTALATAKEAAADADPDAVATGSDRVLPGFPGADAPYGNPVDPHNVLERTVAQHRSFLTTWISAWRGLSASMTSSTYA